jgi:hypothetical protein
MAFLIILVLTFGCSYILPWWFMAIIGLVTALALSTKPSLSFFDGFSAVFVAWFVLGLLKSEPNYFVLATRVAHLIELPSWGVLLIVTSLIGGLVGGMSALSGALIRKSCKK